MTLSRRGLFCGALGALLGRFMPAKKLEWSGLRTIIHSDASLILPPEPRPIAMALTMNTDAFRSQIAGAVAEMEARWPWARGDIFGQNDETDVAYWGA